MKFKHSLKKSNTHISTNSRTNNFQKMTVMCCHCQVRQHALHCDSQPIILDDFLIALCVPFLHPYLVTGIRVYREIPYFPSHWHSFPLPEVPRGKKEPTRLWVVLEWKARAYHSMKFHRQHCDKPLDWGYKQGEWYLVRYRQATTGADISK